MRFRRLQFDSPCIVNYALLLLLLAQSSASAQNSNTEKTNNSLSPAFRKMAVESDREVFPEPRQGPRTAHDAVMLDESFKSSGWQPHQGFYGLVPGVSKPDDVRKKLGEPGKKYLDTSGRTWWYYQEYALSVRFDKGTGAISSIEIKDSYKGEPKIPKTLSEAKQTFGRLDRTTLQRFGIRDYERPGLRVACFDAPESTKPVHLLVIYDPSSAIESAKRMQLKQAAGTDK
jgi:hypothetical protein